MSAAGSVGQIAYVHQPSVIAKVIFYVNNAQATYYFDNSGNAVKPGGGSWAAPSDIRMKTVVREYGSGLAEVTGLRPIVYTFKGNDTPTEPVGEVPYDNSPHREFATKGTEFIGFVAQELEAAMPEMVRKGPGYIDGVAVSDVRMLDTTPLVYALVNAVKELSSRVAALEDQRPPP
jgi:hypothetical protein